MKKLQYLTTAIGIVLASLFPLPLLSQSQNTKGPDNVIEERISLIRECIGQFVYYLQDIANKEIDFETRQFYKDVALKLFIGEGKDWQEEIVGSNGTVIDTIVHKAVTLEMTSPRNPKPRIRPLAAYLQGLIYNRYKPVTIQNVKCYDFSLSELRKVDEGKYVCVMYLKECYIITGNDCSLESTHKITRRIECNLDLVNENESIEMLVKLGDVTAYECHSL